MNGVWGGMDQAALDRQYNARDTVGGTAGLMPFIEAYRRRTDEAKAALEHRVVRFGPSEAETMDFYPAPGGNAPVQVFIHGGYWKMLSKDDSGFAAPNFVRHGAALAALNYALVPSVSLDEIVRQCRAAIAHLYLNAAGLGIDRDRIFVSGSSAGGHLTMAMMTGGWEGGMGVPTGVVRGGCALSGLFDLEPVRLSFVNDFGMTRETAAACSPILHLPERGNPVIFAWGETETEEFKRQSRAMAEVWRARGFRAVDYEVAGRNHFDIVMELCDPSTRLCRDVFVQMGLPVQK